MQPFYVCSSTYNRTLHCSLEHEINYALYRDRLFLRLFSLTYLSSFSPNPFSYSSVYDLAYNNLSYHIPSSPAFPPSHPSKNFPVYSFFQVLIISSFYFLSFLVFSSSLSPSITVSSSLFILRTMLNF